MVIFHSHVTAYQSPYASCMEYFTTFVLKSPSFEAKYTISTWGGYVIIWPILFWLPFFPFLGWHIVRPGPSWAQDPYHAVCGEIFGETPELHYFWNTPEDSQDCVAKKRDTRFCFLKSRGKHPNWLVVTGTWLVFFHDYWECHHPNWLIFFRVFETTNQITIENGHL